MIGVIGGNGVAATNKLCELIENTRVKNGAYRDCHHPEMIVWQATQAPSRSMFLEGKGLSFVDDYVRIGTSLKECGCSHLCMCCNTAHFAIEELEKQIGIPFINIIELTLQAVDKSSKKVGVMCSDGNKKYRLYDNTLKKIAGVSFDIVYPSDEYQEKVTKGICASKDMSRYSINSSNYPQRLFDEVYKHLVSQDCQTIILGCTDINAVFTPPNINGVQCLDSLKVLADYIETNF